MITNDKRKIILLYALTISIITLMIMLSELLSEKEIIFPEIAAIAVGSLVAPTYAWNTNKLRIFTCISVCAILGVAIVRYVPVSAWAQINIAFLIGQLLCYLAQTTFEPMISAIVLPVLLQTNSVVYIVAAIGLTGLILAVQYLLERLKVKEVYTYKPEQYNRSGLVLIVIRSCCILVLSAIALKVGWKFCIAPPLLVAFTEFTRKNSKAVTMPDKFIFSITGCALVAAGCRLVLTIYLGIPLTVAAAVAMCLALLLFHVSKLYIPPAGAMTVLSMLIPESVVHLYPLQVLVGVSVYMALAIGMKYVSENGKMLLLNKVRTEEQD